MSAVRHDAIVFPCRASPFGIRRHTLHRLRGWWESHCGIVVSVDMRAVLRRDLRPVCDFIRRQNRAGSRRVAAVYRLTRDSLSPCVIDARAGRVGPFHGGPYSDWRPQRRRFSVWPAPRPCSPGHRTRLRSRLCRRTRLRRRHRFPLSAAVNGAPTSRCGERRRCTTT